jgi:preprotein translocase subunit SecY
VIPPIFASSIILFPATMVGWFTSDSTSAVLVQGPGCHAVAGSADLRAAGGCDRFFCFFYTALVFNSREGRTT